MRKVTMSSECGHPVSLILSCENEQADSSSMDNPSLNEVTELHHDMETMHNQSQHTSPDNENHQAVVKKIIHHTSDKITTNSSDEQAIHARIEGKVLPVSSVNQIMNPPNDELIVASERKSASIDTKALLLKTEGNVNSCGMVSTCASVCSSASVCMYQSAIANSLQNKHYQNQSHSLLSDGLTGHQMQLCLSISSGTPSHKHTPSDIHTPSDTQPPCDTHMPSNPPPSSATPLTDGLQTPQHHHSHVVMPSTEAGQHTQNLSLNDSSSQKVDRNLTRITTPQHSAESSTPAVTDEQCNAPPIQLVYTPTAQPVAHSHVVKTSFCENPDNPHITDSKPKGGYDQTQNNRQGMNAQLVDKVSALVTEALNKFCHQNIKFRKCVKFCGSLEIDIDDEKSAVIQIRETVSGHYSSEDQQNAVTEPDLTAAPSGCNNIPLLEIKKKKVPTATLR